MTNNPLILLVEDEWPLAEIIKESLEAKGFRVVHAATAASSLEQYYQSKPDALVLDVMLPDEDGFTIAKKLRVADKQTPILFLTARAMPEDVVTGFETGGNDYLKKPFSLAELVVRLKVLLSKDRLLVSKENTLAEVSIGSFTFFYNSCMLHHAGKNRGLTAREAEILKLLFLNRNQVIDRKSLLLNIWGNDDFFSGRSLDVFITKLRKYLAPDPAIKIINIRGVGYKLIA
jgi:DNA-binding response OmpR family regulator